ncbi:lipoprotein signal peptidase [Zafaria cholistanensis]|uniref:Lipoprotein signal peptidase n=1 Tax=Zafaria cholistanensis TaxID=1682741 RepID=A0A5A7NV95_9MICC|nr:signal peptidase II [Zafaria cholistanensis]GER24382.1 lipoprotein signal peptidase [Zafaria cholistanensis]
MEEDPTPGVAPTGTPSGALPVPPARRAGPRLAALALVIAAAGYGLDQLTKWIVETRMYEGQSIDVLPPLLRWHFIRNPGAAFSIGTDVTWIFTLVMIAVVTYILVLLRKVASRAWAVALGALLGGAAGNLTDRLFREPSFGMGHVVDFIALPNFAIFNIADSLIVCSMVGICLLVFRGIGLDGTRSDAGTRTGA